jgi:hypothetical protein
MSSQPSSAAPKPILPPFWKWLMRITFGVTMALFLAPAFYSVKYYVVDKPRETAQIHSASLSQPAQQIPLDADYLPLMEDQARNGLPGERAAAVHRIGETLRQPYISVKRPLECLTAKAALADMAIKDTDPAVRAAASEELGKVAQAGAVIRR